MPKSLPKSWMPSANMKRIHLHWTAGAHTANSVDKKAYHILVEGDGNLVRGDKPINANAKGSGLKQASHTRMANTGAIGVSLCCMRGSKESPFDAGPSPMTETQWEAGIKVIAALAERYDIPVTHQTILTHAEVQPNLNIKQRFKWDINRLAFDPDVRGHKEVGDLMRALVGVELDQDRESIPHEDIDPVNKLTKYRVVDVHPSTLNFRKYPGGEKIGELPERTVVELVAAVGHWWQVRTRLGFVGWVWSEYLKPVE